MGATVAASASPGERDADERDIGVRDLRQRASQVLAEVEHGRSVTITRSGHPIARLVPISQPDDPLEAMVTSGEATRAEDPGDLLEVVPAAPAEGELPSEALARMRDEERW